jgi:hypothetical protein
VAAELAAFAGQGTVPVPRFLGSADDGHFVILAFECVDGARPASPWRHRELARVAATVSRMSAALTPSPVALPADRPRLGGWGTLADDGAAFVRLRACSGWAAAHLDQLIALENRGLVAANGSTMVHFDALPHNPVLRRQPVANTVDDADVTAVLAALAGFWLAGAFEPMSPGLEPIAAAKLHLGRGALWWLQHRLGATSTASSPRSC